MAKMQISPRDVYDLVENDKGEVMILVYAKEPAPQKSTFSFDAQSGILKLNRTKDDVLLVAGLQPAAVKKLATLKNLYVCEIKYTEQDEESEIVYAYAAPLQRTSAKNQSKEIPQVNLAEKAKRVREKALKKTQN